MLTSAKNLEHITDQFIEPYFIQTDSSGIVIASCDKFRSLLSELGFSILEENNLVSIFAEIDDHLSIHQHDIETHGWPNVFDLHVPIAAGEHFIIRWIASPTALKYNIKDGWQLTGMRISTLNNESQKITMHDAVQLQKEKNLSDSIINSMPGIFYLFDHTGKFLRWNKRLETVSGYSREEIAMMSPLDFFEGEEKIREQLNSILV